MIRAPSRGHDPEADRTGLFFGRGMARYVRGAAVLPVVLALGSCLHSPPLEVRDRPAAPTSESPAVFRRDPPVALGVWVTPLVTASAAGNAEVLVRFAADPRLLQELAVDLGGPRTTILRRRPLAPAAVPDGPVEYSAITTIDLDHIQAYQARLRNARATGLAVPIFAQRGLVRFDGLKDASLEPLRPGVQTRIHFLSASPLPRWNRALFMADEDVLLDARNGGRTLDPCAATAGVPLRPWTFGRVMETVAATAGVDAPVLVRQWLERFETAHTVNSDVLGPRAVAELLLPAWERRGNGADRPLDLDLAPFRLQAIVNRADLHENVVFGGRGAEARFIFGAMDLRTPGICPPLSFSVIVEFAVDAQGCGGLAAWADRWRRLDDPALDADPGAYLVALEDLTAAFARPGASVVIRTTEHLDPSAPSYEMREFHLDGGALVEKTVRQTPREPQFDVDGVLARYVSAEGAAILAERHVVPETFGPERAPLLAGAARMSSKTFFWPSPGVGSALMRRRLSLATCNGCHAAETATEIFHVNPLTWPWNTYGLSSFLRDRLVVPDPDLRGNADLPPFDERARRGDALNRLAEAPCLAHFEHQPIRAVH